MHYFEQSKKLQANQCNVWWTLNHLTFHATKIRWLAQNTQQCTLLIYWIFLHWTMKLIMSLAVDGVTPNIMQSCLIRILELKKNKASPNLPLGSKTEGRPTLRFGERSSKEKLADTRIRKDSKFIPVRVINEPSSPQLNNLTQGEIFGCTKAHFKRLCFTLKLLYTCIAQIMAAHMKMAFFLAFIYLGWFVKIYDEGIFPDAKFSSTVI